MDRKNEMLYAFLCFNKAKLRGNPPANEKFKMEEERSVHFLCLWWENPSSKTWPHVQFFRMLCSNNKKGDGHFHRHPKGKDFNYVCQPLRHTRSENRFPSLPVCRGQSSFSLPLATRPAPPARLSAPTPAAPPCAWLFGRIEFRIPRTAARHIKDSQFDKLVFPSS